MKRQTLCVLIAALAASAFRPLEQARADIQLPTGFTYEKLAIGLAIPNSMAFLPDGRLLITEQKSGRVRLYAAGQVSQSAVLIVANVETEGYEQGLQGIAVDPRWPTRPFVYLYYDWIGGSCQVVRYTASGDLSSASGVQVSLARPVLLLGDIPDLSPEHQAGCLRFGPDSMLYVSVGDDAAYCDAADPTSLRGAILRIDVRSISDDAGSIYASVQVPRALIAPQGNPFAVADSNAILVWAFGLRNPWRFHIDPVDGKLFAADVGEATAEEIDEIAAGDFLGWPWREANYVLERPDCPEPGGSGTVSSKRPIVTYDRDAAPTAIISAGPYRPTSGSASNYPAEYWGDVFYGEYYTGLLRHVRRFGTSWRPAPAAPGQHDPDDWAVGLTSCVDYQVGSDGSLWLLRQYDDSMTGVTGSIGRIRWTGTTTSAPLPRAARAILSGRPNPFSTRMSMSFGLERAEHVTLDILDLTGRIVIRLVDSELEAGTHTMGWTGDDSHGRHAPPGLYLATLRHANQKLTIHILLTR